MALALLRCIAKTDRKVGCTRMCHATYVTSCNQPDKVVMVASVLGGQELSINELVTASQKPNWVVF